MLTDEVREDFDRLTEPFRKQQHQVDYDQYIDAATSILEGLRGSIHITDLAAARTYMAHALAKVVRESVEQ